MNDKLRSCLFFILTIIHMSIWLFVIFAFINKKAAYYNLYYVIPFIYILHMLPLHIINNLKQSLYKSDWLDRADNIQNKLIIGKIHTFVVNIFNKSFESPLSTQGMLILGLILSSYRLKSHFDFKNEIIKI